MRIRRLTRNVGFMLDEITHKQLVHATDEKEVTMSKFVREIVSEWLNSRGKGSQDNE